MYNFLEKFFEIIFMILVGLLVLLFIGVLAFSLHHSSKDDVINELCQKQQYDFCEVKETIYKFKEKGQ